MTDSTEDWQAQQTARIARAIRALRGRTSAQELSNLTAELGYTVTRATIADLENGRRKYVSVSELAILAAALGVTPAVLITWEAFPDYSLEVLPDRHVSAPQAAAWYGGFPFPRYDEVYETLPPIKLLVEDLWAATREREHLSELLSQSLVRLRGEADVVLTTLSSRLERVGGLVTNLTEDLRKKKWGVPLRKAGGDPQ